MSQEKQDRELGMEQKITWPWGLRTSHKSVMAGGVPQSPFAPEKDAAAAYTDQAIDQGYRAVQEPLWLG